jgi:hypothetical protein
VDLRGLFCHHRLKSGWSTRASQPAYHSRAAIYPQTPEMAGHPRAPMHSSSTHNSQSPRHASCTLQNMLTLNDARKIIADASKKASEIGQPMNIAVVDSGGNLLAFERMEGAWLGSIDISIKKAWTSRAFNISTPGTQRPQPAKPAILRNSRFQQWQSNDLRRRHPPAKRRRNSRSHRCQRRIGRVRSGRRRSWNQSDLTLFISLIALPRQSFTCVAKSARHYPPHSNPKGL